MLCQKLGAFCQLISPGKLRQVLKGEPKGNVYVDFFPVHWNGFACVPMTSFYRAGQMRLILPKGVSVTVKNCPRLIISL